MMNLCPPTSQYFYRRLMRPRRKFLCSYSSSVRFYYLRKYMYIQMIRIRTRNFSYVAYAISLEISSMPEATSTPVAMAITIPSIQSLVLYAQIGLLLNSFKNSIITSPLIYKLKTYLISAAAARTARMMIPTVSTMLAMCISRPRVMPLQPSRSQAQEHQLWSSYRCRTRH